MDLMPRSVGFPLQRYIETYDEYWDFFMQTRGVATCFTSSQSYPRFASLGAKKIPVTISMNNIFSDFDDEHKPENPLRDNRRLVEFQLKEELPFLTGYSGSKGFANYTILTPRHFKFFVKQDSGRYLKRLVEGIHIFYKNGFRNRPRFKKNTKRVKRWILPTMDKMVMKDPKRLCRMMLSPHCTMSGKFNGRYCCPLTEEQILDWDIRDIVAYSHNPKFVIPKTTKGKTYDLIELADYLGLDFTEIFTGVDQANINDEDLNDIQEIDTKILMLMLQSQKPCIANALKKDPDHFIRFSFVVWMKRMGKSLIEAIKNYENVANHFGYVDRYNFEVRDTQIQHIYEGSYVSEPTCGKLIRDGYCVCESCPRFHKEWKGRESEELFK